MSETESPSEDEPTDWPTFAADMLSGDPERMRRHLPGWLQVSKDEA